eukprot:gene823-2550_t
MCLDIETAEQYGIQAMPTFMVFKGGDKVDTMKGASADALASMIEKHCS